jgi:hypothetical protein
LGVGLIDVATEAGATATGNGLGFFTGVDGGEGMLSFGTKDGSGGGGGTSSFSRSNASSSFSNSELAWADARRQQLIKNETMNCLIEHI